MTSTSSAGAAAAAPLAMAAIDAGQPDELRTIVTDEPDVVGIDLGDCEPARAGQTLLLYCCRWPGGAPRGAASAERLLAAGADPNTRFRGDGETALHWAVSNPHDADIVRALCAGGANVDALGGVVDGGTPLMNAVHFGFPAAAAAMVEAGASIHNLTVAAGVGRLDLMEGWLQSDGDFGDAAFTIDPADPASALGAADRPGMVHGAFGAAVSCDQYQVADWLLDHGAEVDAMPPGADTTALHQVARKGSLAQVMYLVARGADVSARTIQHGATTYQYAWAHGQFENMTFLIGKATDVPLPVAASCGRLDLIAAADPLPAALPAIVGATFGATTAIGKPIDPRIRAGRIAVVRYLAGRHPGLGALEHDGLSLLAIAEADGDTEMAALLQG